MRKIASSRCAVRHQFNGSASNSKGRRRGQRARRAQTARSRTAAAQRQDSCVRVLQKADRREASMSRVLVLYGTTDGHTAKVATRLADVLRSQALDVDVVLAGRERTTPCADDYAAVIVEASVHGGGSQRRVEA